MSVSSLEKHLFNLKLAVKDLERNLKKCERKVTQEKVKVKKALQNGNLDIARTHAENAIRQNKQAAKFLRMSARVDDVTSRVQSTLSTRNVTSSMVGVVSAMELAVSSMNLDKITALMGIFEGQFKDLNVQSSVAENTMPESPSILVKQDEVESLIQQVAEEAGLALNLQLPSSVELVPFDASAQESQEKDELLEFSGSVSSAKEE